MQLGVRKIEHIPADAVHDYSALAPGSSFDLAGFVKSGRSFTELPFLPETADFADKRSFDESGILSKVNFSASIRKNKEQYRSILQKLTGRRNIWRITLISGVKYIIGSPAYVPLFTWDDGVSGISSSEFSLSIECESRHGVYLDVSL